MLIKCMFQIIKWVKYKNQNEEKPRKWCEHNRVVMWTELLVNVGVTVDLIKVMFFLKHNLRKKIGSKLSESQTLKARKKE